MISFLRKNFDFRPFCAFLECCRLVPLGILRKFRPRDFSIRHETHLLVSRNWGTRFCFGFQITLLKNLYTCSLLPNIGLQVIRNAPRAALPVPLLIQITCDFRSIIRCKSLNRSLRNSPNSFSFLFYNFCLWITMFSANVDAPVEAEIAFKEVEKSDNDTGMKSFVPRLLNFRRVECEFWINSSARFVIWSISHVNIEHQRQQNNNCFPSAYFSV